MTKTSPESLTLARLATGEVASVLGLDVSPELHKRLAALGIQVGKAVKVIRRGAFGGPIHVRVGMTEVVLRRKDAGQITVAHPQALAA